MTWELVFPWALALLPVPLLVWKFLPPYRVQSKALRVPFFREVTEVAGIQPKEGAVVLARRRIQMGGAIICWLLIVMGLARPELLGKTITVEKSARDLMLAVDISGSMDIHDMVDTSGTPKQRLAVVKDVVNNFVAEREGDRIGLIVFGTKAYVQSPFTEDLVTVQELMEQTQVGMAGPETAIGDSIGLAIRSFQTSEVEQRVMLLLSDGSDTSSRMSPINAAEIAAQNGVTIHAIGVGDPTAAGADRVDLAALEALARRAGGQFFFADDQRGLTAIYEEIEKLNPRLVETLTYQPRQPIGWVLFAAAAVIGLVLLLGLWVTDRRKGGS